jgi:hypothetical protein
MMSIIASFKNYFADVKRKFVLSFIIKYGIDYRFLIDSFCEVWVILFCLQFACNFY